VKEVVVGTETVVKEVRRARWAGGIWVVGEGGRAAGMGDREWGLRMRPHGSRCVCVYVLMCVHAFVCVRMCVCTRIYVCACECFMCAMCAGMGDQGWVLLMRCRMYRCVCLCMCIRVCVCMWFVRTHKKGLRMGQHMSGWCVYICMGMCVCVCVCACTHMYLCRCVCVLVLGKVGVNTSACNGSTQVARACVLLITCNTAAAFSAASPCRLASPSTHAHMHHHSFTVSQTQTHDAPVCVFVCV